MFYQSISDIYNQLFPFDNQTYNFLKGYAKKELPILDIGCATGGYVKKFIEEGFRAYGLEYEKSFNLKGNFVYGDMTNLPFSKNHKFGLIYSIGNTLVHVNNKKQFYKTIKDAFELLDRKSYLILQIINYDRIYGYEIKELPEIENDTIHAKRIYHYNDENELIFEMIITNKSTKQQKTIKQKLTPLFLEDIKIAASVAGAGFVQFFGNFNGDKFFIKDNLMIIAALYKN